MLPDIEELVTKELGGLCNTCVHRTGCLFRQRSERVVIQCEQFEAWPLDVAARNLPARGLCLNCAKAAVCHLPKEPSGVWHCEEYE